MEGTRKTVCPEDKGLWGGLGLAREKTDLCQIGCITLWPFCHGIPSAKIVQITLVDNKKCGRLTDAPPRSDTHSLPLAGGLCV